MKKYLIFFPLLLSICIGACNSEKLNKEVKDLPLVDKKSNSNDKPSIPIPDSIIINVCDSMGMGNFLVDTAIAKDMIAHFEALYKKDDNQVDIAAFNASYWLDAQAIFDIAKFIRNHNEHDGVRIYFGCEPANATTFPGQQYQNETTIQILSTSFVTSLDPNISTHKDDTMQIPTRSASGNMYLKPWDEAKKKIDEFERVYRRTLTGAANPKDSLSKSVWINACVIFTLESLLTHFYFRLDGVNIIGAAYNNKLEQEYKVKKYRNQSTFLIVPTNPTHTGHKNDWLVVDALKASAHTIAPGGFNHGELCPQVCNQ